MSDRRLLTVSPATGCPPKAAPWAVQSASVPVSKSRLGARPLSSVGNTPAGGVAGAGSAALKTHESVNRNSVAIENRLNLDMALPNDRRPHRCGHQAARNIFPSRENDGKDRD